MAPMSIPSLPTRRRHAFESSVGDMSSTYSRRCGCREAAILPSTMIGRHAGNHLIMGLHDGPRVSPEPNLRQGIRLGHDPADQRADERSSAISIVLATFNGERYLEPLLQSLAGQTIAPLELVVGDDGSRDGTPEIVAEFARTAPFPV